MLQLAKLGLRYRRNEASRFASVNKKREFILLAGDKEVEEIGEMFGAFYKQNREISFSYAASFRGRDKTFRGIYP